MTHKKLTLTVLLLLACGSKFVYCPNPREDIKKWVSNFFCQKSFSYEYRLKTLTSNVSASGECIIGWAEHAKGVWDYGDTVESFEYIGVSNYEWAKKGRKWEESIRGEESNFLAQLERIFAFEKFELLSVDTDYYYKFNATLPFLAPDRWREMVAYIRISKSNFLPVFIWIGLPDSSVFWQVRITGYNNVKMIEPPIVSFNNYKLIIDTVFVRGQVLRSIKRRIALLGLKWKVIMQGSSLLLKVPSVYTTNQVKEALAPGIPLLCGVTQDRLRANRIAFLQSDPKQTIYLTDWQIGIELIKDVAIKYDRMNKLYLLIKLKKKMELPEEIALEIDNVIVVHTALDRNTKMDIIKIPLNMRYLDAERIRSYMSQPLMNIEVVPSTKRSD